MEEMGTDYIQRLKIFKYLNAYLLNINCFCEWKLFHFNLKVSFSVEICLSNEMTFTNALSSLYLTQSYTIKIKKFICNKFEFRLLNNNV